MTGNDAHTPAGQGRAASQDPLLAELRASRPEPPPEVLSPRTGPNRALVEEIIMTGPTDANATTDPTTGHDPDHRRRNDGRRADAGADPDPAVRHSPNRRRGRLLAGAGVVAAAAATFVAVVAAPWSADESRADAMVREAAAATRSALADTGRATVEIVNAFDGEPSGPTVSHFEFAGEDERYQPESGGYENRTVDGENYVLGFDDRHPDQWYLVPCNETERITPDPRSLAAMLTPDGDFEIVGEEEVDGVPTTHLRARSPDVLPADLYDGEGDDDVTMNVGVTTGLDIWVDGDDVTRRFDAEFEMSYDSGPTEVIGWSVQFSDLGEDITVEAPADYEVFDCSAG
jgi:hypothetical protein